MSDLHEAFGSFVPVDPWAGLETLDRIAAGEAGGYRGYKLVDGVNGQHLQTVAVPAELEDEALEDYLLGYERGFRDQVGLTAEHEIRRTPYSAAEAANLSEILRQNL